MNNLDFAEADVFTVVDALMRHGQLEMFRYRVSERKSIKGTVNPEQTE